MSNASSVEISASHAINADSVPFFVASWGYPFLYETYLYHLHRLDHRHNFSPYFYLVYLTHPSIPTPATSPLAMWEKLIRSPLTSFLTQLYLSLGSGLFFVRTRQDMILGWFIQTVTFVIFNKVCTSQVWSSLHILDRSRILISNISLIPVLPLVPVIPAAPYPSSFVVEVFVYQVPHVLDRNPSAMAQPGIQRRIPGRAHLPPFVALQSHLRHWT